MSTWLFFFVGIFVGTLGSLIGVGGGFVLIPLILFLFPYYKPPQVAAISMLTVAANSISSSIALAIRKQIHWPSAALFTTASIPGILVGLHLAKQVPRQKFELIFGFVLMIVALLLFYRTSKKKDLQQNPVLALSTRAAVSGFIVSLFVGVLSSFLGIGGGIIYVPMMAEFMHFPVYVATATSMMILAWTSMINVFGHWQEGNYTDLPSFVPYLTLGVVLGAQIGAKYSKRISSKKILQIFSGVLILVALRLIFK